MIVPASLPPSRTATADDEANPQSWRGAFGATYAQRNPRTAEQIDHVYRQRFGMTRTELSRRFLRGVPRYASVLEVGCSHGVQLDVLRGIGFHGRLVGVDLSWAATLGHSNMAVADGENLPFRDGAFDLVFTSGTLMHVPPERRHAFCAELLRVSRRWVWGFELTSDVPKVWRFPGVLPQAWALPEPDTYLSVCPSLRALDVQHFPNGGMPHVMFMLDQR